MVENCAHRWCEGCTEEDLTVTRTTTVLLRVVSSEHGARGKPTADKKNEYVYLIHGAPRFTRNHHSIVAEKGQDETCCECVSIYSSNSGNLKEKLSQVSAHETKLGRKQTHSGIPRCASQMGPIRLYYSSDRPIDQVGMYDSLALKLLSLDAFS